MVCITRDSRFDLGMLHAIPARMTMAQCMVAYSVCWWLVLFMVLPSGAAPLQNPTLGHAPSAPANPRLRRKFRLTTLLAIIPTLLIYFVATQAKAEDAMYHVGGGCKWLENHVPAANVAAHDGQGVGEKKVAPAALNGRAGDAAFAALDSVEIPLQIPAQNYIDRAARTTTAQNAASNHAIATHSSPTSIHGRNIDLAHSLIETGNLTVTRDGTTRLNGKTLGHDGITSADCAASP